MNNFQVTNYIFGNINDQQVGNIYPDRRSCHDHNIHRGLRQGIGAGGASIVLSGGYEDDKDLGDEIIYTGEGGESPEEALQRELKEELNIEVEITEDLPPYHYSDNSLETEF